MEDRSSHEELERIYDMLDFDKLNAKVNRGS